MRRVLNFNRVRKQDRMAAALRRPKLKIVRSPIVMKFEHPAHQKPVTLPRVKWLERPDP